MRLPSYSLLPLHGYCRTCHSETGTVCLESRYHGHPWLKNSGPEAWDATLGDESHVSVARVAEL